MSEPKDEQEWMISNVDSHETLSSAGEPLFRILFGASALGKYNNNKDVTAYLIRLLADPYPTPSPLVQTLYKLSSGTSGVKQAQSLPLSMLPPELLYTIIDQLHTDALTDKGAGEMAIYCLALTCCIFFRLTKRYVRVWSLGRTTRWMGGRLDSTLRRMSQQDVNTLVEYLTPYYPTRDDWVLYNKDTREYVRAQAIADLCGQPKASQLFFATCAVNLGDVLLSRICWSSEKPDDVTHAGEIHRGVWAGHRFRISTMARLGSLLGKDVSAEVVNAMETIWKGRHGAEWNWPFMPVQPWFR